MAHRNIGIIKAYRRIFGMVSIGRRKIRSTFDQI